MLNAGGVQVFTSGSAMLVDVVSVSDRPKAQGISESMTIVGSCAGTVLSGVVRSMCCSVAKYCKWGVVVTRVGVGAGVGAEWEVVDGDVVLGLRASAARPPRRPRRAHPCTQPLPDAFCRVCLEKVCIH